MSRACSTARRPTIQKSAPVIDRYALATDLDRQQIRILGIDVFAEPPFRNYVGGEDAYGARNTASLVTFLTRPDALALLAEQGFRAVAYRADGGWLRLLSLHPDHDSAYQ